MCGVWCFQWLLRKSIAVKFYVSRMHILVKKPLKTADNIILKWIKHLQFINILLKYTTLY